MEIVYLTSDLLFSSRVRSLAESMGVRVAVVGSRAAAREQVTATHASLVLVDLEHREANAESLVEELSSLDPPPRIVAYAPHVKEALLTAAQTAGCDLVLSRGQFDQQLRSILSSAPRPQNDRRTENESRPDVEIDNLSGGESA